MHKHYRKSLFQTTKRRGSLGVQSARDKDALLVLSPGNLTTP